MFQITIGAARASMLQAQAQTLQLALKIHLVRILEAATFTRNPAACPE